MGARAELKENKQRFIAYVSNHPLEPMRSMDLAERFNAGKSTIVDWWKSIPAALGGTIESKSGNGGGFMWTPAYEAKNNEGYSDPTASAAIGHVVPKTSDGINAGSVYVHRTQSGSMEYIFVVACFEHHTLAIPVVREGDKGDPGPYAYFVDLPGTAETYYMDISRVTTRLRKYTGECICDLGSDVLQEVLLELADILGLDASGGATGARLKKLEANFVNEKNMRMEAEEMIHALDQRAAKAEKMVGDLKNVNDDISRELTGKTAKILMQDKRICELEDELAELRSKLMSAESVTDKRAAIEMKVLKARLDIYEKELFG